MRVDFLMHLFHYSAQKEKQSIVMSFYGCLSNCAHISEITRANFTKFSVCIACDRGLHSNAFSTSAFVYDHHFCPIFALNRPGKGNVSKASAKSDSSGAAQGWRRV